MNNFPFVQLSYKVLLIDASSCDCSCDWLARVSCDLKWNAAHLKWQAQIRSWTCPSSHSAALHCLCVTKLLTNKHIASLKSQGHSWGVYVDECWRRRTLVSVWDAEELEKSDVI